MVKIEEMAAKYSSQIYKEIQGDIPYTDLSGYKKGMLDAIDPYVEDAYIAGASDVLEEIENFMKDLDLGNSAEEKFYKLDVIADIGLFIKHLKK